jgi:lysozyme
MEPRYRVSNAGVALIKRFEGYRRRAARLEAGRWTIGYGHTVSARQGAEVSETDAEALLRYDLMAIVAGLNKSIFTPLTQNQFDALVCFVFNIGLENFSSSSVLRRLNEGAMLQAAAAIELWRGADFEGERIVVDALVRRRAAEKALFLTPSDGFVAAPTPVVEPKLDYAGVAAAPMTTPTELETALDGETATASRIETPAVEPEETSATEDAAAAVKARLEALITDLDERPLVDTADFPATLEPAGPTEVPAEAAPESEPRPFGAFGEQVAAAFDPSLRPTPTSAAFPVEEPPAADGVSPESKPSGWSVFNTQPIEPESLGWAPLAVLGLLGLAVFTGAVFWIFNAKLAGGLLGPMGLGVVVAVVGVLCVASAIYFLLERLGGRED